MPLSKTSLFTRNDNSLADLSRALGHPARIAILRELARRSACVCGEIVQHVPLAQATVSQHLKELRKVGLIKGDVEGPKICYCLDTAGIRRLHDEIGSFLEELREKADAASC